MNDGESQKILSFTDLNSWKYGHEFVLAIYKLTDTFPVKEQFSLSNQMRRAVVSITSNIAEGFSRKSAREKSQFYSIALGSLTEVQNQLIISKDVGYINIASFDEAVLLSITVSKLLNGLIKGVLSRDP